MKNETLARFMWKLQTESGFTSPPPKNKKRGTFAARRESAIEGEKKQKEGSLQTIFAAHRPSFLPFRASEDDQSTASRSWVRLVGLTRALYPPARQGDLST